MPTTRPRYTVTDTAEMAEMLDLAARRWPEVSDRRELLVRLAGAGRDAVASELEAIALSHERQQAAMGRAATLLDVDRLLSDDAWA